MVEIGSQRDAYRAFVEKIGPRLRLVLISAFGPDLGSKATADALVWGWEHWDRLLDVDNPAGQLYRVGKRRVPRMKRPKLPRAATDSGESDLPRSLEQLPAQQRASLLLVHGYGWTEQQSAEGLGISRSSFGRHVTQALAQLREQVVVGPNSDLLAQIEAYATELHKAASPFDELRPRLPVLVEARQPAGPPGRWTLAITAVFIVLAVVAAVALLLEFQ